MTITMTDWQQRVVTEKVELDSKIEKLNLFIKSDAFETLDRIEIELLWDQRALMVRYSEVLGKRIQLFRK